MKLLTNNRSAAVDIIKSETIKHVTDQIAIPLKYLINKILTTVEVQIAFEIGAVKTVFFYESNTWEELKEYVEINMVNLKKQCFQIYLNGFLEFLLILLSTEN